MKKEQRICVLLAIMILGIWELEAKARFTDPEVLEDQNDPRAFRRMRSGFICRELHIRKKNKGKSG